MSEKATLYYIHDPMCSWCWGFRPTWDAIQVSLPERIVVEYVAAGLAPDSAEPMPEDMRTAIEDYWHEIEAKLGTQFNFDFWRLNTPRRSTYMSCRGAIAAKLQNQESVMVDAIQRAYYLHALNPSDAVVLVSLAQQLTVDYNGFDATQFEQDLFSVPVEQEFQRQRKFAQQISDQGYPSLVLKYQDIFYPVVRDYLDANAALNDIENVLN